MGTRNDNVSAAGNSQAEQDFEKEQARLLMDIIYASVQWETENDEVYSGNTFSLTLGDDNITGILTFDPIGMDVRMTSPAELSVHKDVYYRQQTFFARNRPGVRLTKDCTEEGPATEVCKRTAAELLMGLYNDWLELQKRKTDIVRKFGEKPEKEREYLLREQSRVQIVRERILSLARISGELKRLFKAGCFSMEEYRRAKAPIHEKIVNLQKLAKIPDFFSIYFEEEMSALSTVRDKKGVIENVNSENNQ